KAYIISQQKDPQAQQELARQAGNLSREQLRQRARGNGSGERKAPSAKFPLPGGVVVIVQGAELTLGGVIESMLDCVKQLKKGQSDHFDIVTQQRVMASKAKAACQM